METWKLLLIVFLSAVVLGSIVGLIIGKIQVKMMRSRRPVVSRKEMLIFMAVLLVGVGCVLFGVLYSSGSGGTDPVNNPEGMMNPEGAVTGKGEMPEGEGGTLLYGGDKAEGAGDDSTLTDEAGEGDGEEADAEGEEGSDDTDESSSLGVKSNEGTAVAVTDNAGGGRVVMVRPAG